MNAPEKLNWPLPLRKISEDVGKPFSFWIDDERDRAARCVARRAAQQRGDLVYLLARQVRLGLRNIDDLGVTRHVGFNQCLGVRRDFICRNISSRNNEDQTMERRDVHSQGHH